MYTESRADRGRTGIVRAAAIALLLTLPFALTASASVQSATDVYSPTHPNPAVWYSDDSPTFEWGGFPSVLGSVDTAGTASRVEVSGDLAFIADAEGGLVIVDVSQPGTPTVEGVRELCCPARDVAVTGPTVFLALDKTGLVAIDATDPSDPTPVGAFNTTGTALGVATYSHTTFVADGAAGLASFATSDPASPQLLGTVDTSGIAQGVALDGQVAYVASGDAGLFAIDISDPESMSVLASLDTAGDAVAVSIAGNVAYVADGPEGLIAIDITDPTNLTALGALSTASDAEDVLAIGDVAHVALGTDGLLEVDVTDPANPVVIGKGDTNGMALGVSVAGGVAFVADGTAGLTTLDVMNRFTPPTERGKYTYSSWADCVVLEGDVLYVADWDYLQMLDVSDPASPTVVGWIPASPAYMIDVAGDVLYMASGYSGMRLYDVSDPATPVFLGSYNTPGYASRIKVLGNIAYVADWSQGLQIIDVSDPTAPTFMGSYNTPGYARGIDVAAGVAYVGDWGSGLQVLDVSDPTAPSLLGTYNTPGNSFETIVDGSVVYIADWDGGMRTVDVSDPANPTLMGVYATTGSADGVSIDGDTAYVAYSGGFDMVDVADPAAPTGLGTYSYPGGWAFHSAPAGDVVYLGTDTGVKSLQVGEYPSTYARSLDQTPTSTPATATAQPGQDATFSGVASGQWYFHVQPVGRFGTTGTVSHLGVKIDTTPPMTVSDAKSGYIEYASIKMTAADIHSGVTETYFRLDGGATQSGTEATTAALGTHTLEYWSVDVAGNVESISSVEFAVYSGRTRFHPIEGPTRYDTAVDASQEAFPNGADTVIIATGRNWPDALAGGALAGAYDAPILLVTDIVPSAVKAEIARLGASDAIVLGAEGAVPSSVVEELLGMRMTVTRLGGVDRYKTAELIADRVVRKVGDSFDGAAFAATGANFPDALAATPVAGKKLWPIYLVHPSAGAPVARMQADGVTDVLILGGTGAVSDATGNQLETAFGTGSVERLEGTDRYGTAVAVATYGVDKADLKWDWLAIATGQNFPDGLTGGLVPSSKSSVLLLTRTHSLPRVTADALQSQADWIADVYFLGGTGAISQTARSEVAAVLH